MSDSPDSQRSDPIFDKFGTDSEARSTIDTSITPASQLSPPDSPITKNVKLVDNRAKSRTLAASLTLEEQVSIAYRI